MDVHSNSANLSMVTNKPSQAEMWLRDYTPTSLSAQEWAAARPAVIGAVTVVDPPTRATARFLATHLAGFLDLLPDWDHDSRPNLHELINERTIAQHERRMFDRSASDSHRAKARGALRRVARALHGGPRSIRATTSQRGSADLLSGEQLQDLAARAWAAAPSSPAAEALVLAAQIGAGVPGHRLETLTPADIDLTAGTIRCSGVRVGVLADVSAFLQPARTFLASQVPGCPAAPGTVQDVGAAGWPPSEERGKGRGGRSSVTFTGPLPDVLTRPVWLHAHFRAGTPLAVLNQVSALLTGRGLQRHELERLAKLVERPRLDEIAANARTRVLDTLTPDLLAAIRVLKTTLTVTGPEVSPALTRAVEEDRKTPKPRRLSRAAALRAAREAQLESRDPADPIGLDAELQDLPGWTELDPEVAQRISDYRPQRVAAPAWEVVAPVARRLLVHRLVELTNQPGPRPTQRKVNVIGSHLAPFLVWVHHNLEHHDMRDFVRLVLEPTTLDRYTTEDMATAPLGTTATRRSEVRGAVNAARPGPRPQRLPYRPVSPPYTAAEAARHCRLARNQSTRARRRGIAFIVASGYGGGLDGRDMKETRARDILTIDLPDGERAVLIRVRGKRPRTVVLRDQHADLMLYAVQMHYQEGRGRNDLMLGTKSGRRNVTTPALERLVTADGTVVELEVPRMRSTWLVAHMSAPVPLGVLMQAAGLRSVRALSDLLPYTAAPDEDTSVELLRGRHGLLPIATPRGAGDPAATSPGGPAEVPGVVPIGLGSGEGESA